MAHVWRIADDGQWEVSELTGDLLVLPLEHGPIRIGKMPEADDTSPVALRRIARASDETWLLIAGAGAPIRLNGLPVEHGIAALSDRDEIRLGTATPIFFSTERLAHVATYPIDAPRGFCPRCKQPLTSGDPAVKCPGCSLWHHASDRLPCWTYADRCAACPQPTALDAGFQWTPEGL